MLSSVARETLVPVVRCTSGAGGTRPERRGPRRRLPVDVINPLRPWDLIPRLPLRRQLEADAVAYPLAVGILARPPIPLRRSLPKISGNALDLA